MEYYEETVSENTSTVRKYQVTMAQHLQWTFICTEIKWHRRKDCLHINRKQKQQACI